MGLRTALALDFGTANCIIIKKNKGIVLNEPTIVALRKDTRKIIAVGSEAKKMLGKESQNIIVKRPLKNGGISNYKIAFALLSNFFNKVLGNIRVLEPDVYVSVPSRLNSIEERALIKALTNFGVNNIVLYPEAMAAAIGAELPVDKPVGSMIINLGGGTAEIALISLNGIVTSRSHVGTGDQINLEIINHLKETKNIEIGEQTAEKVKIRLANAVKDAKNKTMIISGKNVIESKTTTLVITSNDLIVPVRRVLSNIVRSVEEIFEEVPPELASDITSKGIALSGGSAQLRNIDVFLTKSLGVPCYIVEDPITCVVRGLSNKLT